MSELGQKIIAETRKVAAGNPDFIYEKVKGGCKYIRNGCPSCLLGHALWNLGLIDAEWGGDELVDSSIVNVIKQEAWQLDGDEVVWLEVAQDAQDTGYAWGTAVVRADDPDPYESEPVPAYSDNDYTADEDL